MSPRGRILVIDDEESIRFSISRYLHLHGYESLESRGAGEALNLVRSETLDAAILDWSLPDGDGLSLLAALKAADPSLPIVMLTGHGSIELAVRAIQQGAEQFLTKPVELPALLVLLERLISGRQETRARAAFHRREERTSLDPLKGTSPAMVRLREQVEMVRHSQSPLLILGETGTGKGLLARWLHQMGPRSRAPFVDLNCAGLSATFLESELFGHERGAFTDAVNAKEGLFEAAHRGTLFLDEIGDLPAEVQPKLLKAVEEQRFRRLGEVRERRVDVRLIAATHQHLAQRVEQGRFRSDLYYRINTLTLVMPPLRERAEDVVQLAQDLLERISADLGRSVRRLDDSARRALLSHQWPGNVRELRNVLERAVLVGSGETVDAASLSLEPAPEKRSPAPTATLAAAEASHIRSVLEASASVDAAAQVLGLSRSALYEKLRKHGIPPPQKPPRS